jgi:hypothetical protein
MTNAQVADASQPGAGLDLEKIEREHRQFLDEVRRRGGEDARRHQEDLLDRPLPIDEEARALAEARLERLGAARTAAIARLEQQAAHLRRQGDRLRQEIAAAVAALKAAGESAETAHLPPQHATGPSRYGVAAAGGAVVVALGIVVAAVLRRELVEVAAVTAGAAIVWIAIALAWRPDPVEPPRVTVLRETLRKATVEYECVAAANEAVEISRLEVVDRSRRLAAAERALARALPAAYRSAVISGLPPGALENGARLGDVRDPAPPWPAWGVETAGTQS